MSLGRVLLKFTSLSLRRLGVVQRVLAVNELRSPKLQDVCNGFYSIKLTQSPSHGRLHHLPATSNTSMTATATGPLRELGECDMQPTSISCHVGTAAHHDDDDDDDEEDGVVEVERGTGGKEEDVKEEKMMMTVGEEPCSDETHLTSAETEPSVSDRARKRRMRRKWRSERRKMKNRMSSADDPDDLMSELPFAFSSADTWNSLGFPSGGGVQKKRKRKRENIGGRVESDEDGGKNKKKKERQRPNYFLSIPITNTQISAGVIEVQEAVLQQEPRLAKAMIPAPTLHLTLLVTHLANQEQVDLAVTALSQLEHSLAELLSGQDLVLSFSGIGHFRKEVVFISLEPGESRDTLETLADLLQKRFEEQGLLQGDGHGFEPHLTIMKLSRAPKLRSQGIKRVDPSMYSSHSDRCFGVQMVERVDLCSMLKKKQQDGYYYTEGSLQLGGRGRSEPDEAELLRVSKRLVEDAVNRALQQYKQETLQNGGGPNATATPTDNTKETTSNMNTQATGTTNEMDAQTTGTTTKTDANSTARK